MAVMERVAAIPETDIRWSPRVVNSEHGSLFEVLLALPDPGLRPVTDPATVGHRASVDFRLLGEELMRLAICFESLNIGVRFLSAGVHCGGETSAYNRMLVRDLFTMTPQGAIVARMAGIARAGSERHVARTLALLNVPILRTISGDATFEGADLIWGRSDVAFVGTGRHTNAAGFAQVSVTLREQGVRAIEVPLPDRVTHLQDLVQIVDSDLAVVQAHASAELRDRLCGFGMALVELPEDLEGMNFVVVGPRTVVVPSGSPGVTAALRRAGVAVAAELEASELVKTTGGIASATGILWRG